ncbi:MAG: DUF3459 domain-containing protein [Anaeromyxobacter sp.]|nr:DUF3459 domain-containing protein [Anaeromyxobacter sp.]
MTALALLLGCSSSSPTPPPGGWWRGQTAYEIFVRSFADSDGDGVGDLPGLVDHLDDLNDGDPATSTDLGVAAIWLMPIFPSPSYHGYDVTDYRAINPQYGTLEDFKALVAQAHRRGIKVILDMVLNHTSSQHPWFLDSRQGAGAAQRDWYVWSATDPGWQAPFSGAPAWHPLGSGYFYGVFSDTMPDLSLQNPAVEAELVAAMKFWLGLGVDGFRLDAVRYLVESPGGGLEDQPATHALLARLRATLLQDYPETLLVAEAWATTSTVASYYGRGDEVQLAFSFDQAEAVKRAVANGQASTALSALGAIEEALATRDRGFQAPFLSNHDQVRALRAMGGEPAAARVAAALLFAQPGTPFVYYGEELGMQGGAAADDRNKRTPMRWSATPGDTFGFTTGTPWLAGSEAAGVDVATQRPDPASLWNLYRRLIALRQARPALSAGGVSFPVVSGGGAGALAVLRGSGTVRVVLVANLSATASGPFTVAVAGAPGVLESDGLAGAPTGSGSQLAIPGLAPRGFAFLSLD